MLRRLLFVLSVIACVSCKKTPMDRVEGVRKELAGDTPALDDFAKCGARATCAKDVAASIGGAYDDKKPDQISAAAAAIVIARDKHGSDLGAPDVWLAAMRKAKGPGADALRLASSYALYLGVDAHARKIDDDAAARAFMKHVAAGVPGACATYDALGGGADPDAMPPGDSPDHSACVQRDLARKGGPGATYGQGVFRGAAGALAILEATVAALHEGAAQMDGKYKDALDRRLAILDAALLKIALRSVDAPAGNTWNQMLEPHASKLGGDAAAPR